MSQQNNLTIALAATTGPIALLATWAGWSPIEGMALAIAGGAAAFLAGLATIEPTLERAPRMPLLNSGRWGRQYWIETADGTIWVDPAVAIKLRKTAAKVEVAPTVDGFKLLVPRTRPHAPLAESARLSFFSSAVGWVVFLAVAFSNLSDLHPIRSVVGAGGLLMLAGLFYLLLAWLTAAVLAAWSGVQNQRVKVEGRVLTAGGQRFVLGQAGQRALLTHGWRGARLELSNGRETLVLHGRHAELFELKRQLQRIKGAGSAQDVPQSLRSLQST